MTDQLAFDMRPGLCAVETCPDPATHVAAWSKLDGRSGQAPYCLWHANYMARAWIQVALPPYSWGVTDSVWMERVA